MRISDWSSDVCSSDLPAHHQHRKFVREGDEAFEDRGMAADRLPRFVGIRCVGKPRLPLAVITHACRFEDSGRADFRSEEHTSELQSLMRISYAVFCLKKKKKKQYIINKSTTHQT